MKTSRNLPYNPQKLAREKTRHYISASDSDIQAMLNELGLKKLSDLYADIPENIRMQEQLNLPDELAYDDLLNHVENLAEKNTLRPSFIGDGLQNYRTAKCVSHILGIRNLTTAYTPYQPEISQGTLQAIFEYQSLMAALTGLALIRSCGIRLSDSAWFRRSLTARSTRTRPARNWFSASSPTERTRRLPR
jgi:glycine dehydrogenase